MDAYEETGRVPRCVEKRVEMNYVRRVPRTIVRRVPLDPCGNDLVSPSVIVPASPAPSTLVPAQQAPPTSSTQPMAHSNEPTVAKPESEAEPSLEGGADQRPSLSDEEADSIPGPQDEEANNGGTL